MYHLRRRLLHDDLWLLGRLLIHHLWLLLWLLISGLWLLVSWLWLLVSRLLWGCSNWGSLRYLWLLLDWYHHFELLPRSKTFRHGNLHKSIWCLDL